MSNCKYVLYVFTVPKSVINIEESKRMGTFDKFLQEAGFDERQGDVLYLRKELVGFSPIEVGI